MKNPVEPYLSQFDSFQKESSKDPLWIRRIRERGMEQFAALGFPTTRQEEWRFTSVEPITRSPFARTGPGTTGPLPPPLTPFRIVFLNGHFSRELSADSFPQGMTLRPLSDAFRESDQVEKYLGQLATLELHPFTALNTAFLSDGIFIQISKGTHLEQPIELLFLSQSTNGPTLSHPRVLIVAEEAAQATILETYGGQGRYFTNAVSEIFAAESAVIEHYKLQKEGVEASHVQTIAATGDRGSSLTSTSLSLGGGLVRNDLHFALAGEGAECTLNGLFMASSSQHVDHHTTIDHIRPHGTSRELYKGILGGRSRGVFDGQIFVRPEAQKTNAQQANKNLLLSDDAQINTKPLLMIQADDVKCNHGATIGRLDENELFYLRSRGIAEKEARALLTLAFARDVSSQIRIDPLKREIEQRLLEVILV